MRARIIFILMFMSVLWALMIFRAVYLQILPNSRLEALQKRQFETVVTLQARRGDVLDRDGHELAVSMTAYSIFADPKLVEDAARVAKVLGQELGVAPKVFQSKLKAKKKRFVWLQRQVDRAKAESIQAMKIKGLGMIEESRRIYPNEKLLSHALGFMGSEGQGLEGLELKYNDYLEGSKKKVSLKKDARGRPLIVNGQVFNEAPDGADIQLTIDRDLQFVLEQELGDVVSAESADGAVGVVLDAQTSEILAMASAPSFDPNKASNYEVSSRRNRAITDMYEPGSTMKSVLIAGAMSRGLIEPNTRVDCEGGILKIGKRVIKEADAHHSFKSLTVAEILAYSSNVGAAKIGFKLGEESLRKTLEDFGFGQKTGLDLPGEVSGFIQTQPWHQHLLANISFGHGIGVTALQMANAYAAIANGGLLHQPYIVKKIKDYESDTVTETQPKVVRQVLSREQSEKMKFLLMGTTTKEGTGFNARVRGYSVAGKTGTAQKVNPNGRGYLKGAYISSFAGFIPVHDPKFVIYIAVDNPKKTYYGSQVAAPIFSKVAAYAIRKSGVPPVLTDEEKKLQLAAQNSGHNPKEKIGDKSAERSIADSSERGKLNSELVPDWSGLSLREVLKRVNGHDVTIDIRGNGLVTHTEPPFGNAIGPQKNITIFLSPHAIE